MAENLSHSGPKCIKESLKSCQNIKGSIRETRVNILVNGFNISPQPFPYFFLFFRAETIENPCFFPVFWRGEGVGRSEKTLEGIKIRGGLFLSPDTRSESFPERGKKSYLLFFVQKFSEPLKFSNKFSYSIIFFHIP